MTTKTTTEGWEKEFEQSFVYTEAEMGDEGREYIIGQELREDITLKEIKDFIRTLLNTAKQENAVFWQHGYEQGKKEGKQEGRDERELEMRLELREQYAEITSLLEAARHPQGGLEEDFCPYVGHCNECAYYLDYKDDWQCNGGSMSDKCTCHPEIPKD